MNSMVSRPMARASIRLVSPDSGETLPISEQTSQEFTEILEPAVLAVFQGAATKLITEYVMEVIQREAANASGSGEPDQAEISMAAYHQTISDLVQARQYAAEANNALLATIARLSSRSFAELNAIVSSTYAGQYIRIGSDLARAVQLTLETLAEQFASAG